MEQLSHPHFAGTRNEMLASELDVVSLYTHYGYGALVKYWLQAGPRALRGVVSATN